MAQREATIPRVVLCDPDPTTRSALERALADAAIVVDACADAREASLIIHRESPDVSVVAVETLAGASQEWIRTLSRDEERPVLVLAQQNFDRSTLPFVVGPEDWFERPFSVLDLLARIRWAAARSQSTEELERGAALCSFDLAAMDLPDILQLLANKDRSGTLSLSGPAGTASVWLHKGRVVHAAERDIIGKKAFCRLIRRRTGAAEFREGTARIRTIQSGSDALLLQSLQKVDEYERALSWLPRPSSTLHLSEHADTQAPADLRSAPATAILHTLGGGSTTLEEILDRTDHVDADVVGALGALLMTGAVRVDRVAQGPELFSSEEVHVLRDRLGLKGEKLATIKLTVVAITRRLLEEWISLFLEIEGARLLSSDGVPSVGPVAALQSGELVLEVWTLPPQQTMAPLWRPLAHGTFAFLVLAGDQASDLLFARPLVDYLVRGCTVNGVALMKGQPGTIADSADLGVPVHGWMSEVGAAVSLIRTLTGLESRRGRGSSRTRGQQ